MAFDALQIIRLKDDFYRDRFRLILLALGMVLIAIGLLVATSLYIFLSKPSPVYFSTDNEWRVLKPVPLNVAYLSTPDLFQWTTEAITSSFTYDYTNYSNHYTDNLQYFTDNGQKIYLDVLNKFAPYNMIVNTRTFLNGVPSGAPTILTQGILKDRYAWWVQMPMQLRFSGYQRSYMQSITIQVLVVRIPTLNNINGVAIDNIIVPVAKTGAPVQGGMNV